MSSCTRRLEHIITPSRVTPTSLETFVVRVYRQTNKVNTLPPLPGSHLTSDNQIGFLKAFSDVPEAFTYGLAPLQTVLTQLKIREVMIWPR